MPLPPAFDDSAIHVSIVFCSRASKWSSHAASRRPPRSSRRSSWRNDVVRVVRARARVRERSEERAGQPRRGLHPHEAGAMRRVAEDLVDLGLIEGHHRPEVAFHHEPRHQLEHRRPHVHDLLARRVEADGVVRRRADDARGARPLRLIFGLALEEVLALARDAHAKAWRRAVGLAVIDDPRAVRGGVGIEDLGPAAGPARELCDAGPVHAEAVGEPGGVGHLVEAVGVHGLTVALDAEGLDERPEDHVVCAVPDEGRDVDVGGARDVVRILRRGGGTAGEGDGAQIGVDRERVSERESPFAGGARAGGERSERSE